MLANAPAVLELACVVLGRMGIAFKFAADRRVFLMMNAKGWSRGGAGKFITAYPADEDQCRQALEALHAALAGYKGPVILSDRRYRGGIVQYRYGGIRPTRRLTIRGQFQPVLQGPDGTVVDDQRLPFFHLPPGVTDPFREPEPASDPGEAWTMGDGRYLLEAPLRFSSSGGVYRATDRRTGRTVVVKEARPFTSQAANGADAVWTLKKEHRLLMLLEGTGVAPAPVEFLQDWEHFYLVQEFVPGGTLRIHTAGGPVALLLRLDPSREDAEAFVAHFCSLYARIARMLQVVHGEGIVFGDLSPYNVMVEPGGAAVRLIDFEAAHEADVDLQNVMFTRGFAPEQGPQARAADPADDRFAFGSLMLAGLLPVNSLIALDERGFEPLLASCVRDLGFPQAIADCIRALMHPDRSRRPLLPDVIRVLEADHPVGTPRVGTAELDGEDVGLLLGRMVAYIRSTADPARADRLFPAAPMVFETNPLSVAFGACGVAYALHRVGGSAGDETLDWIERQPVTPEAYPPGLYLGSAGIAWVLLELGRRERAEALLRASDDHPLRWSSPDLFYGAAGRGMTHLRFFLSTGDERYLARAREAGEFLLGSRKSEDGRSWWMAEEREYCGMGHGGSGISLYLLYLSLASGDDRYLHAGREGIEHVISRAIRTPEGALTWTVQEGHRTYTPYWRWGTAGVGAAVLRYWAVLGDPRYRAALDGLIPDVHRKYSIFPGLHLGLAGMADFLLDAEAFGLPGGEGGERLAARPLSGMLHFKVRREAGIAFPGETRSRISCDLATGSAGMALVLDRWHRGTGPAFMLDELLPAGRTRSNELLHTAGAGDARFLQPLTQR
jgi:hypothetical protein